MIIVTVLVGLIIGTLVGLSGIGGAILLLPMLIVVLNVPPLIAVGSGAVFAAVTKIGAAGVHWHQGTVDLRLALFLALGSVPGAMIGFAALTTLQATYGDRIGDILEVLIGILLLIVPLVMLGQTVLARWRADHTPDETESESDSKVIWPILIGLLGGILVGLTSVGSGSIILILLLLTSRKEPSALVGTDIVHAVLLTGLTGAMHLLVLSSVDFQLVGLLVLGSLPGAYLGARVSRFVSATKLRFVLLGLVIVAGIALII